MVGGLNDSKEEILLFIDKMGVVTRKTQPAFTNVFSYYACLCWMRDTGLITLDGVSEENIKAWKLTQKGKDVARLLKELRDIENSISKVMERI